VLQRSGRLVDPWVGDDIIHSSTMPVALVSQHRRPRLAVTLPYVMGMVFWLIGANAPIMKIYFKCISKNHKKIE
jgi:hypothetical protein